MPASSSTSAPAAGCSYGRSQATAAYSVPTVRFRVPRSKPALHVARLRKGYRGCERSCEGSSNRLGERSARMHHLGNTCSSFDREPGAVLRDRVAGRADLHGRRVLAQRPPLRSSPLLRHGTVLLAPRARGAPLRTWCGAVGRERMVNAFHSPCCLWRGLHLCARVALRTVPRFAGPPLRR